MNKALFSLFIASVVLTACGGAAAPAIATSLPPAPTPSAATALQVVIVPSELVVGPNRFAVGLLDPSGHMYLDGKVHFRYFDVTHPNSPVVESEADAERLATPDNTTAIFAQERNFDRAGDWGVEVQAQFPDGTTAVNRVAFTVLASSKSVAPGSKAPSIHTPTAADVTGNLALLTSAPTPNPAFYQSSLDNALANGKPTVLLFATPAFCQSRLCGPSYEVLNQVRKDIGGAANFIHIEVYAGLPNPASSGWQLSPTMQAFGLSSDPWLYLIDAKGVVAYRVEGLITDKEIERHLKPLIGG